MRLNIVIIIMCVMFAVVCVVNSFAVGFIMNLANIVLCIYDMIENRQRKKGDK